MNKLTALIASFFRSPVLWGSLVAAIYYAGIEVGLINSELLLRFTAGHSVEYIVTAVFFVGAAALVIKGLEIGGQRKFPKDLLLGPIPLGGQSVDDASRLSTILESAPVPLQKGYLVRRLREVLDHIHRTGDAESLDTEIKYLSDMDAVRAQHGYAFVRVIIWAIPILGLLGTVIGITSVFANLNVKHIDESLPSVMAGLKVAFDTTGLALGLSMVLMFGQYFVDKVESGLLIEVDARANAELKGRFQVSTLGSDPQLAPIRRMVEAVLQSNDRLVNRQVEIWRTSIDAVGHQQGQLALTSGKQLETALSGALEQSLKVHATQLGAAERAQTELNQRHWAQFQQTLAQVAEAATRQQAELAKQTEILLKVVEATGQVTRLEDALNRNLTTLSGTRNFDETAMALAAAVQLLSARISPATEMQPVALARTQRVEKAA